MGVKEAINRRPKATAGVAAAAVVLVVGIVLAQRRGAGVVEPPRTSSGLPPVWFTTDDGATWFPQPAFLISPSKMPDGKTGYRCYLWTCDGGKTKFVSHLERMQAADRREYAERAEVQPGDLPPSGAMEVKLPGTGDQGWVPAYSPAGTQIRKPKGPAGSREEPKPVWGRS